MTPERALALYRLLTEAELNVWVDGGWGVDALVGRQTREHGDLDLGIARPDLDRAVEVLATVGYRILDARYIEVTLQLVDPDGRRIDLHPSTPVAGGTEQIDFDGNTFHIFPPEVGYIGGQAVRCMPLVTQLRTHAGYELRPQDHHDLALLRGLAVTLSNDQD
jgi:lincosamide nucleotidyltransferase A/C/D/E